uniref:NAD(P)/FAD-dependent oxidoreductase n=1 Tax=Janibacter limosus TaxID=53458 RepID=A0AC61U7Y6_9MICO
MQPGLPRPHLQRQDHLLPGQPPRLPRDRAGHRPDPAGQAPAVVGAGPAGPAFATTAAERGHHVTLFDGADDIGGQLDVARRVPGKEEFDETLRYFRHKLADTGVDVKLGARVEADDLTGYDEVAIATGVTPRVPDLPGTDHPTVVTYLDVLRGGVEVGRRVAILGAGGIGFDVAAFITDPGDEASPDIAAFQRTRGIDGDHTTRGGLVPPSHRSAPREVTLLQRKTTKVGKGLGKTTGWIHRGELAARGVTMVPGVTYERIDDDGLHVTIDGQQQVLAVDTIVLCTGQEPSRGLHDELRAKGATVHLIGGADIAAELDAKRAIDRGTRIAAQV